MQLGLLLFSHGVAAVAFSNRMVAELIKTKYRHSIVRPAYRGGKMKFTKIDSTLIYPA
jgi:hypothetical protein